MKFYQVIEADDPAGGDVFFPTLKAAEEHLKAGYEDGDARIQTHEVRGRLTKKRVCQMLNDWPQR